MKSILKSLSKISNTQASILLLMFSIIIYITASAIRFMDINTSKDQFISTAITYADYMKFSEHLFNISTYISLGLFIAAVVLILNTIFKGD